MPYKTQFFPETQFGGFTHVDGTVNFFTRVNALLEPSSVVLDVGCGREAFLQHYDLPIGVARICSILGVPSSAGEPEARNVVNSTRLGTTTP